MYVCATNVKNGRSKFFSSGSLVRAVMASSAIPVIFSPVEINGKHYIDGGITNNLPVEPLVGHCDKIIGLHCNPVDKAYDTGNMKELLERTFIITINGNVENRKKVCDLFLEPYELKKFGAFDFAKAKEIFSVGYAHALENEGRIMSIFENNNNI
jgi:NTE family protein